MEAGRKITSTTHKLARVQRAQKAKQLGVEVSQVSYRECLSYVMKNLNSKDEAYFAVDGKIEASLIFDSPEDEVKADKRQIRSNYFVNSDVTVIRGVEGEKFSIDGVVYVVADGEFKNTEIKENKVDYESEIEELKNSFPESEITYKKKGIEFKIKCYASHFANKEAMFKVECEGEKRCFTLIKSKKQASFWKSIKTSLGKIGGINIEDDRVWNHLLCHEKEIENHHAKIEDIYKDWAESKEIKELKLNYDTSIGFWIGGIIKRRHDCQSILSMLNSCRDSYREEIREFLEEYKTEDNYGDYTVSMSYNIPMQKALDLAELLRKKIDEKYEKQNAKRKKELQEKLKEHESMSLKDVALRYFCDTVACDDEGYFCADHEVPCFFVKPWKKDVPKDVVSCASFATVTGNNGKDYKYRQYDEKSAKVFVENHASILEAKKQERIEYYKGVIATK